ncbi:MAG: hypothetical protein ACJ735_17650 [Actinomycetes bacterium]
MRKQYHFRPSPGGLYAWDVNRLIALSAGLPTEAVALADVTEIDSNWWYAHESEPTVRSIVEHVRLINDADLSHPIIIDPDGRLMDGMHRVAKALLLGRATIAAKRLPVLPEPDHTDYQTDDPPRSR